MIKVFQKRYPDAKFLRSGSGEVEIEMVFNATKNPKQDE
jgi:hypothetical protein